MDRKDPLTLYQERLNAVDRRRWLYPMTSAELLEAAARIYQVCAQNVLPRTFLLAVVAYFGISFLFAFVIPALFGVNAGAGIASDTSRALVALVIGFFVAIPAAMVGLAGSFVVAMQAAEPVVMGEAEPLRPADSISPLRITWLLTGVAALSFAPILLCVILITAGAWLETAGISALAIVLALAGWFLAFGAIPFAVVVYARLSLAPCIAVRERLRGLAAIRRSWQLSKTRGRIGGITEPIFYVLLIFLFLAGGIFGIVSLAIHFLTIQPVIDGWLNGMIWGQFGRAALSVLPGFFVIWLLTPFLAIATTLLYFDRLIRLEAFDIRVLARDVMEVRN